MVAGKSEQSSVIEWPLAVLGSRGVRPGGRLDVLKGRLELPKKSEVVDSIV
jgi:hypothetical protein